MSEWINVKDRLDWLDPEIEVPTDDGAKMDGGMNDGH